VPEGGAGSGDLCYFLDCRDRITSSASHFREIVQVSPDMILARRSCRGRSRRGTGPAEKFAEQVHDHVVMGCRAKSL